ALFTIHPINGLADLLYITLFGARPYAVSTGRGRRRATVTEVFHAPGHEDAVAHLTCRSADPATCGAALSAAYEGRVITLDDPLGIYISSFARERFRSGGEAIPGHWVRLRRGQGGLYQRLELGPDDAEPFFLDDITIAEGAGLRPLTGGFDVVAAVEVGPIVRAGPGSPVAEADHILIPERHGGLDCRASARCADIRALMQRRRATTQGRGLLRLWI